MDFWVSIRDCHEPCKWWKRNEGDEYTDDELIMKRPPSGYFYAKEYSPEYYDNNIHGGSFMSDRTTVTIRTPDDVTGIKNNCIVEYQGEKWLVVNAQKKNIRNGMAEFALEEDIPQYWHIQLRK